MSLRKLISKLIPGFLLRPILIARDRRELSRIPVASCDWESLRPADQVSLEDSLNSPATHEAWESVRTTLDSFEIPDMTGGVNPGDRRALFHLAISLKVKRVLEIGSHIGASTCHLAAAIQQNVAGRAGPDDDCHKLLSVDILDVNDPEKRPWLQHGARWSPSELVKKLGCEEFVVFETAASIDFLKSCEEKFDLIFLDGDHSAQTTYHEIAAALKLLNRDGVILLHDYFPDMRPLWSNGAVISGPYLAAQRLLEETNAFRVVPLGELPWPTKLESNLTSLALVLKTR